MAGSSPLSGATVTAVDSTGMFQETVTAGSNGSFDLTTLPPGNYTLTAEVSGFMPRTTSVDISPGQSVSGVSLASVPTAIDTSSQPVGGPLPPAPPPSSSPGWLTQSTTIVNLQNKVIPPAANPCCQPLYAIAVAKYNNLQNMFQAVDLAQEGANPTWRGINADTGIVTITRLKVIADLVAVGANIYAAGDALLDAVEEALGIAQAAGTQASIYTDLQEFSTYLAMQRPNIIALTTAIYSGYEAYVNNQPGPSLASILDSVRRLATIAGQLAIKAGALESIAGQFSVFAPLAGAATTFVTFINDFLSAQQIYNTAEQNLENGLNTLSNAQFALAAAKLAFAIARHNLINCNASNGKNPNPVKLPGGKGGGTTKVNNGKPGDPNNLVGPAGFGPQGFIQPETMPFEVDFENEPTATAAAQVVTATMTLDPNLDSSTFQFTGFGFGAFNFTVPTGLSQYSTTIDLRPDGIDLLVPVTLNLNQATGVVTVTFQSLDPATVEPPDGINAGFLPVDDANHDGEGYFTFTAQPKAGLPTGTTISAQASIVFDTNAAIATPTSLNTLDVGPPASAVTALPNTEKSPAFTVSWSGRDDTSGSGIAFYDVFVSDNGGPYVTFLTATTTTSIQFQGVAGHTYSFYSVATDNVGNRQPTPTAAQATTCVASFPTSTVNSLPATTSTTTFTVSWSGSPGPGATSITSYEIFVSKDGGAFTPFLNHTTATSTTLTGQPGNTYGFYSVATNNLGVTQPAPKAAQATTALPSPPVPPKIIGEKAVFSRKTNSKGKPVGKAVLTGFSLTFNAALNSGAAMIPGNYQLDNVTTKKVKKKVMTILKPITKFTVSYVPATDTVDLNLIGTQAFATGGRLTVESRVTGAAGRRLAEQRCLLYPRRETRSRRPRPRPETQCSCAKCLVPTLPRRNDEQIGPRWSEARLWKTVFARRAREQDRPRSRPAGESTTGQNRDHMEQSLSGLLQLRDPGVQFLELHCTQHTAHGYGDHEDHAIGRHHGEGRISTVPLPEPLGET